MSNPMYFLLSAALQTTRFTLQLKNERTICSYCKKIRDDQNSWLQLEQYISSHSEALFSHGVCPHCFEEQMNLIEKKYEVC